jgi:hypothetical protein
VIGWSWVSALSITGAGMLTDSTIRSFTGGGKFEV